MDTFQRKFLEEATDLINTLEQSLLSLELDPNNSSIIDEIFRVMHSLKGGGGMFGFEKLSEFTHHLETVYDLVRKHKVAVNRELLDITLTSVDHLRNLLSTEVTPAILATNDILTQRIIKFSIEDHHQNTSILSHLELLDPEQDIPESFVTYNIRFEPHANIMHNGTNPLLLLDELSHLGLTLVNYMEHLPALENLEYQNNYSSWQIVLATNKPRESILDVFIFVEDDAHIVVEEIFPNSIFQFPDLVNKISENLGNNQLLETEKIKLLVAEYVKANAISQSLNSVQEVAEDASVVKQKLSSFSKESVISSIRVSSDKIDQLMNLVSELVTTQASLSLYVDKHNLHGLTQISENIENITRMLRDTAFTISLIPLEHLITRFKRLVRDLSNEFGKDISLITEGAETELDKTLIQSITEPMMHLLRNSIDHGIETVHERIAKGKPAQGKIYIKAFYSGSYVHIQVSDDGRGINPDFIKKRATEKGLIQSDVNLSQKEIYDLLFLPGFSTADVVTDVSGRGVGMDVVKRKIEEIRGSVDLHSDIDVGTTLTLKLPITLSIIDGLLVNLGSEQYIIPLSVVDKIYAATNNEIQNSFNNIITLDGKQFPFYNLHDEFESDGESPKKQEVVVVKFDEQKIGLAVDYVVGEIQAVLKPLGKHFRKQEFFSGATILGNGQIALVLDTSKVISEYTVMQMIE